MKILLITHGFPPSESAGAEVYAAQTAQILAARGHEVTVLAPTAHGDAAEYEIREEERSDALRVLRLTNRYRELYDLSWTYANPRIEAVVKELVRRERPDVVHVHHTIGTTVRALDAVRDLGIPLVVTLHDYWFLCPRGQRLMPNGHLCAQIDPARCSACIRKKRLSYAATTASGWWRGRHPRAPAGLVSRAVTLPVELVRHARRELGAGAIRRRSRALLEALGRADALLAPSRFLLEEYVQAGVPRERFRHWPYGIDRTPFAGVQRRAADDGRLRFGFVGSLQPSKGVDLLVRAFADVPPAAAGLVVHGDVSAAAGAPYRRRLDDLAARGAPADIRFAGPFEHGRIGEILAAVDVLVVPSQWYENWPLTLLESVLAGTAVITTDHGGMREFAETFGTAVTFRPGDLADLARAIHRFLAEPDLAFRLGAGAQREVRTLEDDGASLAGLYEELVDRAAGR